LNAIRSRCNTLDLELTKIGHYGWLADVMLNDMNLQINHKEEILNWIWRNWDCLNERSIRTLEKMSQSIIDDPTNYTDLWEMDFLNDDSLWT
jgi:hypothetical protein